jgi:TonB family protein
VKVALFFAGSALAIQRIIFSAVQTEAMTVHSSKSALHLLKFTFFLLIAAMVWTLAPAAYAQTSQGQASARKVKVSVPPEYPEMARKLNIEGMARVLAIVNAEGNVVTVKELGGNPVLVAALIQAVKKWKYEAAEKESEIEVRYQFVLEHA